MVDGIAKAVGAAGEAAKNFWVFSCPRRVLAAANKPEG
jgi:hypothetical protein